MITRLARYHPFLWLLGLTLAVYGVWAVSKLEYDDHGIGTALFVVTYALMQPFWLARNFVFSVLGHTPTPSKAVVWWLLGVLLYVAADRALTLWSRRSSAPNEAA